ncbi:MAG: rane-bound metal-dependent hydrolase [Marmoricola sp.]|nr:rane-bound metal-dependent hydrolase [Marmoricola sp.]
MQAVQPEGCGGPGRDAGSPGNASGVTTLPGRPSRYPAAGRLLSAPWMPVLALALVLGLDAVRGTRHLGLALDGLTDEAAHLATATVVLLAVVATHDLRRLRRGLVAVLAGSVLIDVDHVPLYAGLRGVADGGRPFSHSPVTVVVLLAAAAALPRLRPVLLGLAAGVVLHFVRDVATGPGLPLGWPVTTASVRVPYWWTTTPLGLLALAGVARRLRDQRSPRQQSDV